MGRGVLREISDFIEHKIQESNTKWNEQQRQQNQEFLRQSELHISAIFQEHLEQIVRDNNFFSNDATVDIIRCQSDNAMRSWHLTIQTGANPMHDMMNNRVITRLNGNAQIYWKQFLIKKNKEIRQLQMDMDCEREHPEKFIPTMGQIEGRYELLNYSFVFESIEYEPDSKKSLVNIRLKIWLNGKC